MPEKRKFYKRVRFKPKVIKEAINKIETILNIEKAPGRYEISTTSEGWQYSTKEEFFADYQKGFIEASILKMYDHGHEGQFQFSADGDGTRVSVGLANRSDVESIFNVFESHVEECRLPKQPRTEAKAKTNWITETIDKIEGRCPIAGHKLKSALIKLDSEETEEWQNATMLIRDAWIELAQWLCQVNNIDTSDIEADAVIDRLRKLKIHKTDDRLFNLARASFNLSAKHHKRDIDQDTATACVVSTIVSMQTVIREVFNAPS